MPRQSLSDAVYAQLERRIVDGAFAPGAALPAERALCAQLGVNRGAVREAIKRLEQAGLVAVQHGGGTRVRDFRRTGGLELLPALLRTPEGGVDVAVARSIVEMRSALAQDLSGRAAARRTEAHLAELRGTVAEMAAADGDVPRLQRLAMTFWDRMVAASDNLAYRLAYNTLARTYEPLFDLLTHVLADELTDLPGYEGLVEAVAAGEAELARAVARDLTARGEAGLIRVLGALEDDG